MSVKGFNFDGTVQKYDYDHLDNKIEKTTLAPEFIPAKAYLAGDMVFYEGKLYSRKTDGTDQSWILSNWTETDIEERLTAVEEDVSDLKGDLSSITGIKVVEWDYGKFYNIENNKINIDSPYSGTNWRSSVISCESDDVFYINTRGGSVTPAWAFVDSSYNVLSSATQFINNETTITAPTNAAYLILNDNQKTADSFIGIPIQVEMNGQPAKSEAYIETLNKYLMAAGTVSSYSSALDVPNNTIVRIPSTTTSSSFSGLPSDFYGKAGLLVRFSSYSESAQDGYAAFILFDLFKTTYFGFCGGSSITWSLVHDTTSLFPAIGGIGSAQSPNDLANGAYKITSNQTENNFPGLPYYNTGTLLKFVPQLPSTTGNGFDSYIFFTNQHQYVGWNNGSGITWKELGVVPPQYQHIQDVFATLGRETNKIVLMGDSITAGVGGTNYNGTVTPTADPPDTSGGLIVEMNIGKFYRNSKGYCWANELKDYLETNYPNTTVINNGCTGTHSDQGDTYFEDLVPEGTTILIVSYGINDRSTVNQDTILHQSSIVDKARARGIKVLLMTPKEVTQNESSFLYNSYQIMQKVKTVGSNKAMEVGDMWAELDYYCYITGTALASLLTDGLHPNDIGYTVMFNLTKRILGV